jgi:hypothetical protein
MPDVPTFAELGLTGFEDVPYYGFFAPVGTPQAEIERFTAALAKVITTPEVRDKLTGWGLILHQGQPGLCWWLGRWRTTPNSHRQQLAGVKGTRFLQGNARLAHGSFLSRKVRGMNQAKGK